MRMKSITIGIALGILAVSLAAAQPKPPSKEERLRHLKEGLELTTEQIKLVDQVLAATDKKVGELRKNGIGDPRSYMEAMKKIFDEEDAKIEQILTDVQKTTFAKMKEEREKHRPGAPGGAPPRS
ncbi:MAG: hypothetical protein HYX75_19335 [Acidobacteria bacterium]|nr:hypothetical protein [Acidobacteriota bacterium]